MMFRSFGMLARSPDLALAAVLTAAAVLVIVVGVPVGAVRVAAGVLLVICLPGYALLSAIFPEPAWGRSSQSAGTRLGYLDRILFGPILSVAVAVVGGLVLNATSWGIRGDAWVFWLTGATILCLAVAMWRREPGQSNGNRRIVLGLTKWQGLLLASTVAIFFCALQVARISAERQPYAGYTQLWLLPEHREGSSSVRIGVHNLESRPATYDVVLSAGGRRVRVWKSMRLRSGGEWIRIIKLGTRNGRPRPRTSASGPVVTMPTTVEVRLYLSGDRRKPYRYAVLKP